MPGSNERSVQLIGNIDQISDCVHHFLDEVNKVGVSFGTGFDFCYPAVGSHISVSFEVELNHNVLVCVLTERSSGSNLFV